MATNDCKPLPLLSEKDIARFLSKVNTSGGPDACHPWTGPTDEDGYGVCFGGRKNLKAHRVALFLGRTHPESVLRGEQNAATKLTAEQVLEIRRLYAEGKTSQATLGSIFGVNQTMIGFIVRRVKWTHI